MKDKLQRATRLALLLGVMGGVMGCNDRPMTVKGMPQAQPPTPRFAAAAVLPDGFRVELELAADEDTRQQGLMFRESLEPGRGMLFLFPQPAELSFWMKNTLIPLDMIWLDGEGTVVAVRKNVPPCRADPCPSYSPGTVASRVLELGAGQADRHALKVGDRIRFQGLDSTLVR